MANANRGPGQATVQMQLGTTSLLLTLAGIGLRYRMVMGTCGIQHGLAMYQHRTGSARQNKLILAQLGPGRCGAAAMQDRGPASA